MRARTKQDQGTPEWILDRTRQLYVIDLDPCGNRWTQDNVDASTTLDKDEGDDGLTADWSELIGYHENGIGGAWVNPEFKSGSVWHWLAKCHDEQGKDWGGERPHMSLICPDDPTPDHQELAYGVANARARLRKRVQFECEGLLDAEGEPRKNHSNPWPSVIHYFGDQPGAFCDIWADIAEVTVLGRGLRG